MIDVAAEHFYMCSMGEDGAVFQNGWMYMRRRTLFRPKTPVIANRGESWAPG